MVFIGDSSNVALTDRLSEVLGLPPIYPDVHIFPDGEQRVFIRDEVGGHDAIVLKSQSTPVDSNVIQFLFTLNALRESSIGSVTAIVPYLGYQRQDHTFRAGEAASLRVFIDAIEAQEIDKIVLLDPHSIKIVDMFKIEAVAETALSIFAKRIKDLVPDLSQVTVATPDLGGLRRIKLISDILGVEFTAIEKDRDVETGNITMAGFQGAKPKETVCIIDDMISSGKTMVQAINTYHEQGVQNIYAFATHPLLSENAPSLLENSPVKGVFVTDSIGIPQEKLFSKLEVLTVAELLASAVK